MPHHKTHHQFQLAPPRRWSGAGLIVAIVVGLAASAWVVARRLPDARDRIHATMGAARPVADTMTVYKSSLCECCGRWVTRLREAGFTIRVADQSDVAATRARLGVPAEAASCHSATIGGYVVEGHVPPDDILRLLRERPRVTGIAAPGMPTGAPGMDGAREPYAVVTFDRGGIVGTFAVR